MATTEAQVVRMGQSIEYKKLNITDKYPGRLELALVHQAANKFGVAEHNGTKLCACCDNYVEVRQIECCANLTQVGCDPGITVFFNFVKTVVIFAVFIFLVGSTYNLYTNYVGRQCGNPNIAPLVHCVPNVIFTFSPVNKLMNKDQFYNMQLLTLVTAILSVLFFIFYRKIHYDVYMLAQELVQNQEEFTLYITNIPVVMDGAGSIDYETRVQNLLTAEIDKWIAKNEQNPGQNPPHIPGQKYIPNFPRIYESFKKNSRESFNAPYQTPKVVDVHLCWDIRELTQLQRIKTETKNNIQGLAQQMDDAKEQAEGSTDPKAQQMITTMNGNLTKFSNQLRTVNNEYVKLCAEYSNKQNVGYSEHLANFLGKAFVCFQYQHFAQVIRIMMKREDIKMGDNTLRAVWAPSPRDVNWGNLNINPWVRRKKELISFLILVLAILFSFVVQTGVQIFQTMMGPNPEMGQPPKQEMRQLMIIGTVMGIASSGLTFLTNFLLFKTMSQLIIFEKHESITDEQTSLLWKTLISQFINTNLIFYAFNYLLPAPIWSPQGIVYSASNMLILMPLFQMIAKVVGPGYLFWKIGKCWNLRQGPLESPMFQDNLNTEMELPPFELGQSYTEYLNIIYMAAFFAYIAPWSSLFIALVTSIGYFADKWHLTRHYSLKTHYSYDMSTEALKLFEFVPFVFVLGQILFSYMFHGPSWILWLALAITLIYPLIINNLPAFLYIRLMSTWLRYQKYSYKYCSDNNKFEFTYLNSNPLTRFTSLLHNKDTFMTLQEAQRFLQYQIKETQAQPYPKYDPNTMVLNREQQRLQEQQQQQQSQQQQQVQQSGYQSQLGANRSVYGNSYNQGQNYQLGSQYGTFNYQSVPQK